MKWVAIAGGWRKSNQQVEDDVRKIVREIIQRGVGIVSGGALRVDYFALDEALKSNPSATQIKIFLPCSLEKYAVHYRMRAHEGVITHELAEQLIEQLTRLKKVNPDALIENKNNTVVDKEAYYERITKIVDASDELVAFHVNKSEGTQDTITKAEKKGIPVKIFSYTIE